MYSIFNPVGSVPGTFSYPKYQNRTCLNIYFLVFYNVYCVCLQKTTLSLMLSVLKPFFSKNSVSRGETLLNNLLGEMFRLYWQSSLEYNEMGSLWSIKMDELCKSLKPQFEYLMVGIQSSKKCLMTHDIMFASILGSLWVWRGLGP